MNAHYTNANKRAVFNEYLVVRSQEGDAEALQQLMRLWHSRLYGYAIGQLRDVEAAEDATQDSLMSIARGIHRLTDPASFPKWAYQIVIRRCADWQRKEMRWRTRHVTDSTVTDKHAVVTVNKSNDDIEALRIAIAQLQPQLSNVVRLHYLESFSVEEIATLLKLPKGTIKSRLYYARKRLKHLLEERDA